MIVLEKALGKKNSFKYGQWIGLAFLFHLNAVVYINGQPSVNDIRLYSVNSSSGSARSSVMSLDWSIGQVYDRTVSSGQVVTTGYQQPSFQISSNLISKTSDLNISIWPNPSTDRISISMDDRKSEKYTYHIRDANGRILDQGALDGHQDVDISQLQPQFYILEIVGEERVLGAYKIIKF